MDHSRHHLYATIDVGLARVARTRVLLNDSVNPEWNETFDILYAYTSCEYVVISIKKELPNSAKVVGRIRIPVSKIVSGQAVEGWYEMYDEDFSETISKAEIQVRLQFRNVTEDPFWGSGIRTQNFDGVKNSYFTQRKGCNISLYQNSHRTSQFQPRIELEGGQNLYRPPRLWEEIYHHIDGAQKFIYIAGWAVNTKISLVRDRKRMVPEGITVGELLKKKADEGVRVLVLIWEDRTALNFLKNQGLMKTHGDETSPYFKNTNVICFQ